MGLVRISLNCSNRSIDSEIRCFTEVTGIANIKLGDILRIPWRERFGLSIGREFESKLRIPVVAITR